MYSAAIQGITYLVISYKDDMLPVNLEQEQRKDVDIKKVVEWITK